MIKKVKHHLKKVKHKHIFGILIITLVVVGFISYKWKVNKVIGADGNEDASFYSALINSGNHNGLALVDNPFMYSETTSIALKTTNNNLEAIYVGGTFVKINGHSPSRLIKLNANGGENTAFNNQLGTGFNDDVYSLLVLPDGDILVGGRFTSLNGNSAIPDRLVRLNSSGTVDTDTSFNTNIGSGFNDFVFSLISLPDGDILVGGSYTTFKGNSRNRIVRLNNDGSVDSTTSFNSNTQIGFNNSVNILYKLPDGDILVGGSYTTFNGNSRNRIVRLNNDGSVDSTTSFNSNTQTGFSDSVHSITEYYGNIFIGGRFDYLNGICVKRIVKLNNNAELNTTFNNNLNNNGQNNPNCNNENYGFESNVENGAIIKTIIPQGNKLLIGGQLSSINSIIVGGLVRLDYDGLFDYDFNTNLSANGGGTCPGNNLSKGFCTNEQVNIVAVQPNDKILVGGEYSTLNNLSRHGLVRLESSNTIPEVTITANPTTVDETQTNVPLTYTLHLSSPLAQSITVYLNYNGTATPPPSVNKDYTTLFSTTNIQIPAGQTNVNIPNPAIYTIDDDVYEGTTPETIIATITNIIPAGVATGINNSATINITSNEELPIINIEPQPVPQAVEQTTTSINFRLEPTVRSYEDISVNFKLDGTASRELDYKGVSGALPETLTGTIPAYNSFKTTSEFTLYDDTLIEGQEIIRTDDINITSGNATPGSPGIFTIYDNETNDPPSVSLYFYPFSSIPNSYTMSWFISGNATSCTKSSNSNNSGWNGTVNPTNGSQVISNVIVNTTFSINCTGPDGNDSDSVDIIVDKIPVNLSSTTQWKRGILNVSGLQVDTASIFEKGLNIINSNAQNDKVISSVTSSSGIVADWVYLNNSGQNLDPWVRISPSSLVRLNTDNLNDNIILQNNSVIYKTNETITESNKEQYKFIHENGTGNLFFGLGAGSLSISTSNNTGVGYNALNSLQPGNSNITAFGANAGKMITGNNHTVLGYNAHKENHGALNDISIGSESGNCTLCNQGNNISIGANSGPINANLTHTVSIGHDAHANVNHSMMFGNSSVLGWGFGTSPGSGEAIKVGFSGGENGNGAFLTSGGTWTSTSDKSLKHDIVDLSYGLNEIMKLRPVDFKWNFNNQKDIGFVAQEVKEILPKIVGGEEGEMGISYSKISPVLTKALQEQQIIIDNYKERIKLLKNRIEILENK